MSAFIDPATALRLARESRDEQLRRDELLRLARSARRRPPRTPSQRRRRWRVRWHRPVLAH